MSGLFAPSKQTTTSENNPYGGLPDWARDYYNRDMNSGSGLIERAKTVMDSRGPNSIVGPSGFEKTAVKNLLTENQQAQRLGEQAKNSVINGNNRAAGLYDKSLGVAKAGADTAAGYDRRAIDAATGYDKRAIGAATSYDDQAVRAASSGDQQALATLSKFGGLSADALTEAQRRAMGYMDDAEGALGGERYESAYTDDVVNTTLAGMDRNAMRERMERGNSEAGIGGLGGTRAAVADALAGQLHGQDRAAQEASLRDSGFRFASEMGLQEADFYRGLGSDSSAMGNDKANLLRGLGNDKSGMLRDVGQDRASLLRGVGQDRASLLRGVGQDQSELFRGVGEDSFDRNFQQAGLMQDAAGNFSTMGLAESGRLLDVAGAGMDAQTTASQSQGILGELNRNTQQARNDNPMEELDWYSSIFNGSRGLPATGAGTTTGTTPGPSKAAQIMGLASSAAGIWSGLG